MAKTRQPVKYPLDGITRDESPNSVIAHSATLSHPSSASGSMEHRLFHPYGDHSVQEQRYSISDVDNEFALSDTAGKYISHGFKKGFSAEEGHADADSAESDLDSSRAMAQKDLSQDTTSEHSSPDTNSTISKDSKSSIQCSSKLALATSTPYMIKASASVMKEHIDLPMYSFSAALRECQNKKSQTEFDGSKGSNSLMEYDDFLKACAVISTPSRFMERKRPASMDLIPEVNSRDAAGICNNSYSPKILNTVRETRRIDTEKTMLSSLNQTDYTKDHDLQKKRLYDSQSSSASGKIRSLHSPGTPSRLHALSAANSWSLERVSMAASVYNAGRLAQKYIPGQNMKSLPSKWDDAEKWLFNPASGDIPTQAILHRSNGDNPRRLKSKSGPLAALGPDSPSRPLYYARNIRSGSIHNLSSPCRLANSENGISEPARLAINAAGFDSSQEGLKSPENSALQINRGDNIVGKSYIIRSASVDGRSECVFQAKQLPAIDMGNEDSEVPDLVKEPVNRITDYVPELGEQTRISAANTKGAANGRSRREIQLSTPSFLDMFTQDKHADDAVKQTLTSSFTEDMTPIPKTTKCVEESSGSTMKDAATEISPTISRRDMGTQITPLGSSRTSGCTTPQKNNSPARHNTPARRSTSGNNSTLEVLELQSCHLAKLEIRDPNQPENVLIPCPGKKIVAASGWSTREEEEEESSRCLRYLDSEDWKKNIMEARAMAWQEAERSKCLASFGRFKREEAKITAWENHQKAKAEAELKKLEVKVEKLRSNSTEKIMNKLASALKKAEDMRVSLAASQAEQMAKTVDRAECIRRTGYVGTLGACFTCNV